MTDNHIGFIGAGQIGEPMVVRLAAAGRRVSVYARRPDVRGRLSTAGATVVNTPDELGGVDVLAGCLFDDAQVREVVTPLISRLPRGAVFYSHTTGSPIVLERLAELGEKYGVSVVDAPFSGNADAVRGGQLTVLLGGDSDSAVTIVEETIGAYAGTILRTGKLGSALCAKLLNNVLFAACTQLTLTALESAASLGISEERLFEVLAVSSGGSVAARHLAAAPVAAATFAQDLPRYLSKDIGAALAVAADIGLDIDQLVTATRLGPMNLQSDPVAVAT